MERIQKDYGALIMDGHRIYDIEGEITDNGTIFKDANAFETGRGICYVSEHGLEEIQEELTDLDAIYENARPGEESYLTDENYLNQREQIIIKHAETRQTIINQVEEAYGEDYLLSEAQVEFVAKAIFEQADWAFICTYLTDSFFIEDCIQFDELKGGGIFTPTQHEAIQKGVTPADYLIVSTQ